MTEFDRNMEHGTSLAEYETSLIIFIDEEYGYKFKVWALKRVTFLSN